MVVTSLVPALGTSVLVPLSFWYQVPHLVQSDNTLLVPYMVLSLSIKHRTAAVSVSAEVLVPKLNYWHQNVGSKVVPTITKGKS